jgi:hypothetical protein
LPHHAIEVKLCKRLEESFEPVSLTEYVAAIILCVEAIPNRQG